MVASFKTNLLTWLKTKVYVKNEIDTKLQNKSDSNHTHTTATVSANGFLSKEDKSKLDGIAIEANKIVVDSSLSSSSTNPVQNKIINNALSGKANSSHKHPGLDGIQDIEVSGGGTQNTAGYRKAFRLKINSQYFDAPISFEFVERLSSQTGRVHIVFNSVKGSTDPPLKNFTYEGRIDQPLYLYKESSGTWVFIIKEQSTYETVNIRFLPLCTNIRNACTITPLNEYLSSLPTENIQVCSMITATSATAGYMSSSDKSKLDGIDSGATKVTVDTSLSSTSTNPVQNKVVNSALSGKANSSHTHTASQISDLTVSTHTLANGAKLYKYGKIVMCVLFNVAFSGKTAYTWNNLFTNIPSAYQPIGGTNPIYAHSSEIMLSVQGPSIQIYPYKTSGNVFNTLVWITD